MAGNPAGVNPEMAIEDVRAVGVRINPPANEIGPVATLLVAVKPQMFREAGAQLKSLTGTDTLVISIMAGVPVATINNVCGGRVVRAMPNTPAAIGRGIGPHVDGGAAMMRRDHSVCVTVDDQQSRPVCGRGARARRQRQRWPVPMHGDQCGHRRM
eukprot:gene53791-73573_t